MSQLILAETEKSLTPVSISTGSRGKEHHARGHLRQGPRDHLQQGSKPSGAVLAPSHWLLVSFSTPIRRGCPPPSALQVLSKGLQVLRNGNPITLDHTLHHSKVGTSLPTHVLSYADMHIHASYSR